MANTLTSAGWYIDTPSTAVIDKRTLYLIAFVWDGGPNSTNGNRCVIQNAAGAPTWSSTADGPDWYATQSFPQWALNGVDLRIPIQGLIVPELDNGYLYFYFQPY